VPCIQGVTEGARALIEGPRLGHLGRRSPALERSHSGRLWPSRRFSRPGPWMRDSNSNIRGHDLDEALPSFGREVVVVVGPPKNFLSVVVWGRPRTTQVVLSPWRGHYPRPSCAWQEHTQDHHRPTGTGMGTPPEQGRVQKVACLLLPCGPFPWRPLSVPLCRGVGVRVGGVGLSDSQTPPPEPHGATAPQSHPP
jgi:hypothetical protein